MTRHVKWQDPGPATGENGFPLRRYPFRSLAVDGTFLVPTTATGRRDRQRQVSSAAANHGRRNGKRFSVTLAEVDEIADRAVIMVRRIQ